MVGIPTSLSGEGGNSRALFTPTTEFGGDVQDHASRSGEMKVSNNQNNGDNDTYKSSGM